MGYCFRNNAMSEWGPWGEMLVAGGCTMRAKLLLLTFIKVSYMKCEIKYKNISTKDAHAGRARANMAFSQ